MGLPHTIIRRIVEASYYHRPLNLHSDSPFLPEALAAYLKEPGLCLQVTAIPDIHQSSSAIRDKHTGFPHTE